MRWSVSFEIKVVHFLKAMERLEGSREISKVLKGQVYFVMDKEWFGFPLPIELNFLVFIVLFRMESIRIWRHPLAYCSLIVELAYETMVSSFKFCKKNIIWITLFVLIIFGPRYIEGPHSPVRDSPISANSFIFWLILSVETLFWLWLL